MTKDRQHTRPGREDVHVSPGLWVGLLAGVPMIAYGTRGVIEHLSGVQLSSFLRWYLGAAIVHDLLIGPLVVSIAWLLSSRLPALVLGPVQAALLASGVIGIVSWPFIRGYGVTPGEDSFLSRDYMASVVIIWIAIWLAALLTVGFRAARRGGLRQAFRRIVGRLPSSPPRAGGAGHDMAS